jgi:polygalacturonase
MKNGVFWVVTPCGSCKNPQRFKSPYVSMSSLPIEEYYVRFEIFTAVTMKNVVYWGITTQKTPFFIVAAVKISNLTNSQILVENLKAFPNLLI